jgi:hypothetical protein
VCTDTDHENQVAIFLEPVVFKAVIFRRKIHYIIDAAQLCSV